jgi:AcrR family transcriptional regulator
MLESSSRDRKTERREGTRAEILAVAWEVAREKGLADLTLRDVAGRMGMRAPSLYSYFESKNAIYDAMFAQAWTEYLNVIEVTEPTLPDAPRARLTAIARTFFDYAVGDLARHQLMNQRTIPGFQPSLSAYAPAVLVLDKARAELAGLGIADAGHFDLFTALVGGLVDAQQANDPGGDRWSRLLDEAMDMYADHIALPEPNPKEPDD